ncbi:hypothetical protein CGRA01v4_03268 [Colletotrichum graminicola]|nr:hypothetical protein CGRA01v4_03268 [Colletotrichum graminicola]
MRRTTPYYPYRTPPIHVSSSSPLFFSLHRLSLGHRPVVCVTPITLYHQPTGSARRVIQSCTESLLRHRRSSIAKSPPNGPLIGVSQTAPQATSLPTFPARPSNIHCAVHKPSVPRRDTGQTTVNNHPGLAHLPWCT